MDRDHVAWPSGGRAILGCCGNRPGHDDVVDRRSSFLRAGLFDTTNVFGISAGKGCIEFALGSFFGLAGVKLLTSRWRRRSLSQRRRLLNWSIAWLWPGLGHFELFNRPRVHVRFSSVGTVKSKFRPGINSAESNSYRNSIVLANAGARGLDPQGTQGCKYSNDRPPVKPEACTGPGPSRPGPTNRSALCVAHGREVPEATPSGT